MHTRAHPTHFLPAYHVWKRHARWGVVGWNWLFLLSPLSTMPDKMEDLSKEGWKMSKATKENTKQDGDTLHVACLHAAFSIYISILYGQQAGRQLSLSKKTALHHAPVGCRLCTCILLVRQLSLIMSALIALASPSLYLFNNKQGFGVASSLWRALGVACCCLLCLLTHVWPC